MHAIVGRAGGTPDLTLPAAQWTQPATPLVLTNGVGRFGPLHTLVGGSQFFQALEQAEP